MPKINLLYYKNVLDLAMEKFFARFNSSFSKDRDLYVFSSEITRVGMKKLLKDLVIETVENIVPSWKIDNPEYWFLIGGCFPKDSLVLKYRDKEDYFPAKLNALLGKKPDIRWVLAENDIKLDIDLLNTLFSEIFLEIALKKTKLKDSRPNVMLVSHKNLDCYMIFKIMKWIFGKTVCINVYERDRLSEKKLPLVAINDLVSKYIHNKQLINKSKDFKQCALEVKQQVEELIRSSKLIKS